MGTVTGVIQIDLEGLRKMIEEITEQKIAQFMADHPNAKEVQISMNTGSGQATFKQMEEWLKNAIRMA